MDTLLTDEKMKELKLPSLGEGIESGTIVSILVKVGDTITLEQSLIEVETDKVNVEVPADSEGVVTAILVNVGEEISEGSSFVRLETDSVADETIVVDSIPDAPVKVDLEASEEVIVQTKIPEVATKSVQEIETVPAPKTARNGNFRASPLAKKMAKEIGIDITTIPVVKSSGRISLQDVKDYSKQLNQNGTTGSMNLQSVALPDFSKWGHVRREVMTGIMQATSKNMTTAWSQIPHAWLQEKADITDLEAKRQVHKATVKGQGGALTITSILVKVVAKALEEFPIFNASIDGQNKELIFKEYINIGVAADTDRGLLVPVLQNADQKSITEIAFELGQLSQKAREKKIGANELEGATFTISNLGGIGTTAIFPIVNFPQVAILGIAASQTEAVWIDGQFQPRLLMPMTIAFDHRAINGADAARFLKHVKNLLEDWFLWSL